MWVGVRTLSYSAQATQTLEATQGGFDVYLHSKMCHPEFFNAAQAQV